MATMGGKSQTLIFSALLTFSLIDGILIPTDLTTRLINEKIPPDL
jgi:hypothetical protein